MEKLYGNRRSDEELKKITDALNALTYKLDEQPDFTGTDEQLKMMQSLERCYIDGYPKVSDEEWDILKRQFHYHESLTAEAPSGREWVRMQAPLPSILKAATLKELDDFLDQFDGQEFLIEPKMDGLTANMVYKLKNEGYYELMCITSRGNGRYGLKLHEHALDGVELVGVPKRISTADVNKICNGLPDIFELRGEAVIQKTKENVERYLQSEDELGSGEVVVWRSIVSGIFNRKVPNNLPGLINYLYGTSLSEFLKSAKMQSIACENIKCVEVTELPNARLIASLGNDKHKFLRSSKLYVLDDSTVFVVHDDGETCHFKPYDEMIHVISYSCAIDGVNIDTDLIAKIPGVLYINSIKCDGKNTPFATVFSNKKDILNLICKFYGCDENGKRKADLPRYRNLHEFALDGIVIKLAKSNADTQGLTIRNAKSNANKLVIPKYPLDQIACKLESEIVEVKLEKIESSTTGLNNVTYQGILDRGYRTESGAIVSKINLHNPGWLKLNDWIKEGATYRMVMAMDIIPVLLPPENK